MHPLKTIFTALLMAVCIALPSMAAQSDTSPHLVTVLIKDGKAVDSLKSSLKATTPQPLKDGVQIIRTHFSEKEIKDIENTENMWCANINVPEGAAVAPFNFNPRIEYLKDDSESVTHDSPDNSKAATAPGVTGLLNYKGSKLGFLLNVKILNPFSFDDNPGLPVSHYNITDSVDISSKVNAAVILLPNKGYSDSHVFGGGVKEQGAIVLIAR